MNTTQSVSWLTLFAGLGVGSIIAALVGRWSAKAVTISNHRQNWINALRDDLVVFLQKIDTMRFSLAMASGDPNIDGKLSELENIREAKEAALLVYRRILLRLNMSEKPHVELGELLNGLLVVRETDDDRQIDAVVKLSREIVKHEWAVAKYGMFAGPVTYLKTFWRHSSPNPH